MHSPIPINEAEARRSLHAGIDKAVTRSLVKQCVPEECFPRVPMPVDINDADQFPNIAEAARYAREKGLV